MQILSLLLSTIIFFSSFVAKVILQLNDNFFLKSCLKDDRIVEIRSCNIKPGTRDGFQKSFVDQVLPANSITAFLNKINAMEKKTTQQSDSAKLSTLNALFIKNFLTQDVSAHDKIIHRDFVCIESSGQIVQRDKYMKEWATGYEKSGYTSFSYTDEFIRIFGNTALVRSKTVYTKIVDGKKVNGNTIYTDTYVKENGEWKCVQAQLTAIKNN